MSDLWIGRPLTAQREVCVVIDEERLQAVRVYIHKVHRTTLLYLTMDYRRVLSAVPVDLRRQAKEILHVACVE